jgi:hypothetical protein
MPILAARGGTIVTTDRAAGRIGGSRTTRAAVPADSPGFRESRAEQAHQINWRQIADSTGLHTGAV